MDTTNQLEVSGLYGHSPCMNSKEVCILHEANEVSLRCLVEGLNCPLAPARAVSSFSLYPAQFRWIYHFEVMPPPPLSHAAVLHQPKIITTYMYLRPLRHSYHLMHYTSTVYLRPLRHACYLQQLHPYQIKGSLGMHSSVVLW